MKKPELHSIKEQNFINNKELLVANLNETSKRRFTLRQRLAFSLLNGLALGVMCLVSIYSSSPWPFWTTLLCVTGCIVLWLLGGALRKQHKKINVIFMLLGWILLGALAGSALIPADLAGLLTVTCVIFFTISGCIVDVACFRQIRSPAAQYTHNGLWILAGCILSYLFPETEWILFSSGLYAISIIFLLNASTNAVFDTYRSNEYLAAASNIPTALLFRKR